MLSSAMSKCVALLLIHHRLAVPDVPYFRKALGPPLDEVAARLLFNVVYSAYDRVLVQYFSVLARVFLLHYCRAYVCRFHMQNAIHVLEVSNIIEKNQERFNRCYPLIMTVVSQPYGRRQVRNEINTLYLRCSHSLCCGCSWMWLPMNWHW